MVWRAARIAALGGSEVAHEVACEAGDGGDLGAGRFEAAERLTGDRICAMTRFDNSVLPWFGLPRSLPNR